MNSTSQIDPVVDRLESALAAEMFPSEWKQWGSRLLDHLRKPVQVAVMGLPGSGKSTLVNMMLGNTYVPRGKCLPVVEIAHGRKTRSMFELEDGSFIRRSELLTDLEVPENAVRARLELPSEDLVRHNFVEVGLTGNFGHQMSMVNWVVQWADIILWCTETFDETEARLWAGVPDDIKDHSFLVLTMADRQMLRGVLQDRIDALEPVVSEEFLCLYPIATEQAISARAAEAEVNRSLWETSGGKQLFDGLMTQVENGRTADMDQAQMLLQKFAPSLARKEPDRTANANRAGGLSDAPAAKPRPQTVGLNDALRFLQNQANGMLDSLETGDAADSGDILNQCMDVANGLADMLQEMDPSDVVVQEVQSDAQEGAELMLLFQLEKDEDAAVDGVTLLLQLKKEISDKISAPKGNGD